MLTKSGVETDGTPCIISSGTDVTDLNIDEIVAAGRLFLLVGVHSVEDGAANGRRGGGRSLRILEKIKILISDNGD